MEFSFWQTVTSFGFIVTFSIVAGAFLPLLYSLYVTWENNKEDVVYEVVEQIEQSE